MSVVMRLIGVMLPEGDMAPVDRWLVAFDPNGHGGHAVTTADRAKARRFADAQAALACWRQTSATHPLRRDGKPNRPLTAYTVELTQAEDPA